MLNSLPREAGLVPTLFWQDCYAASLISTELEETWHKLNFSGGGGSCLCLPILSLNEGIFNSNPILTRLAAMYRFFLQKVGQ